ncbi:glycosyltransferase [Sphingomonas profundi]|uniref:glycosyltransferase n=1 Tax=Alterirhizorhabdus profundi TaxID=2681549 RepID=UPI0012E97A6E|nr:glycosyltransferase family A protein [Sphingomonas profundi]
MSQPTVTCLTVTRATAERLPRLRASIAAFDRQSWPLRRLVIVVDGAAGGDAAAVRAMIAGRADATLLLPPAGLPLGALRNLAWDAATGDHVCQWDDDDLHHPGRIAAQLVALGDADAVALAEVLHLFEDEASLYWTQWAATPVGAHPGTLLCRRTAAVRYPESGAASHIGEDTAVALVLRARGALATLAGAPHLYVYVAHGANVSAMAHHRMLAQTLGLSQGLMRRRERAIRAMLADTDLGPGPIVARGPNGAAFTLAPDPAR